MELDIYGLTLPSNDITVVALEDSIFVATVNNIKKLTGFLSSNIEEFLNNLNNEYNLVTSSTRKQLGSLRANIERDLDKITPRMLDMSVLVPKGFGVPLLRILNYLEKENDDILKETKDALIDLDKDLSKLMTEESMRKTLSVVKPKRRPKYMEKKDDDLMNLLKKGTGGLTTINTLVDNKDRLLEGIGKAYDVFSAIKKSDFVEITNLNKIIGSKIEAFRYLIDVEKEDITKVALENIIFKIDDAAKLSTILAKHQLMSFEVARAYIKIGLLIKKIK